MERNFNYYADIAANLQMQLTIIPVEHELHQRIQAAVAQILTTKYCPAGEVNQIFKDAAEYIVKQNPELKEPSRDPQ